MVSLGGLLGVVEVTAVAIYVQYWWPQLDGWIPALVAWLVIVGPNLFSARVFGFIEVGAEGLILFRTAWDRFQRPSEPPYARPARTVV